MMASSHGAIFKWLATAVGCPEIDEDLRYATQLG